MVYYARVVGKIGGSGCGDELVMKCATYKNKGGFFERVVIDRTTE